MLDAGTLPPWQLVGLAFGVAFLYSSVGFGGGSGYLAAMSLFAIATQLIASTALTLNILVASIAFITYWRSGHFDASLLWPFLVTSVPAAFVGGYFPVPDRLYLGLLYLALAYVGVQLLLWDRTARSTAPTTRASWPLILGSGLLIGLLSGMVGLGGGIFLSPLIILMGWGTPKQAAASSAGFIVVNSASGLLGRILGGTFLLGVLGATLLPVGFAGALIGSRLGARYLSGTFLRRVLGIILLLTVISFVYQAIY